MPMGTRTTTKTPAEPSGGILAVDRSLRVMTCDTGARQLFRQELRAGDTFEFQHFFQDPFLARIRAAVDAALNDGETTRARKLRIRDCPYICLFAVMPLVHGDEEIIGVLLDIQPVVVLPRSGKADVVPFDSAAIRHEKLLESLPEGVFTINTAWRIAAFNRIAEEITGFRREEVIGKHCWEVFRSDLCREQCPLRVALENGAACIDQDVRILKKGGAKQTILVNAGVLLDDSGRVVGAVETFRPLTGEVRVPRGVKDEYTFADIVGKSAAMQRIFRMLPDIAASDTNVLICGESGTGKDLLARTIHSHSPRRDLPFIAVNCSALAESLLESELFGHEKAAFTGATDTKPGRFELARGGTLFLDEIGELKPELQVKLLRVLETHEFERVGGGRSIPMEARIISATNRDLKQCIADGCMREDFYYRLRTVPVMIPPLRERPEDIELLVHYFIERLNRRSGKCVRTVDAKVMRFFETYAWPGNVRELLRTLEYAYVFVRGSVILMRNLPEAAEFSHSGPSEAASPDAPLDPRSRPAIVWALSQTDGRRKEAAALLGISRTSLWRRMKELGISL